MQNFLQPTFCSPTLRPIQISEVGGELRVPLRNATRKIISHRFFETLPNCKCIQKGRKTFTRDNRIERQTLQFHKNLAELRIG